MKLDQDFFPINLKTWLADNRHLLKPPVGNRQIWENREFMVTAVGGPNSRSDFHINEGEEFFYQIEGDITLRTLDRSGQIRNVLIQEGDIYLLPPKIPHSPQRPAGTIGLVLERRRLPHELDGFAWFCQDCGNKLYEEYLHITNIVTQLSPVFDRFYGNSANTICKNCGTRAQEN